MFLSNAIASFLLLATTERRLSPRTVTLYTAALGKLEAFTKAKGCTRLADLTPNLLRGAAAAQMAELGKHEHAQNWRGGEAMGSAIVSATRAMIRRLHEEFADLPLPDISMVKTPRVPKRIQPRLEEGEYVRLEAALQLRLLRGRVPRFLIARDMAILALLGNTGLRANECSGLDTGDIDLKEGSVRVRRGKGNKWRILTVRDPDPSVKDGGEVVQALRDYMAWRERIFADYDSDAFWLTLRGNRVNPAELRRMLGNLCQDAGLDSSRPPHAFRRAYFTEQYRDQPNALPVLIERMGWESDVMVKVYTRGVDVELARRIPLPLLSKKWRAAPVPRGRVLSLASSGGGAGGLTADDPARASLGRVDTERGRLDDARRRRRHSQ